MANTNLFIMSKGSKPGDTPTVATNPNAYYDTPTNPLVICTDTLTADTTVACYEIRNDDSFPKNGKPVATGVLVNNGSGYSTSVSGIVVDTVDPRIKFQEEAYKYFDEIIDGQEVLASTIYHVSGESLPTSRKIIPK